jgi:class 3 adenylate cyclase
MAIQPTFLLIADIAGYTRFMKFHRESLAHAQDIVARLLEAVIDAARPHLTLAKLEGDAAFFYLPMTAQREPDLRFVAERAAEIYRAFHRRVSDISVNNLCACDGCRQAGNLKIKMVGHLGQAAVQKVKHLTELAGVDVIIVHRMLKNGVPIPEYLLMTESVLARIGDDLRDRAAKLSLQLDDIGRIDAHYVDLQRYVGEVPAAPRRGWLRRLGRTLSLTARSLPALLGLRTPCAGFRNLAAPTSAN